jgi:methylmalonyl-CoA decarboxylase
MKYIKVEISGTIATIILNNDEKRNSLNLEMLGEIEDTFDSLVNKEIRAVILKSNRNSKVWCAGFNIEELPDPGKDPLPYSHPLEDVVRKIQQFKAPVISMVTAGVWGGGFELVLSCDIVIGSPNCSFAITPAKLGVPYNSSGLMHFLNVLHMNIVKELFFTAKPIKAERAFNIGLINHLIQEDDIEEFTYKMAQGIAQNSPLSIKVIKEQLRLLGNSQSLNSETMERINELRSIAYSSDDYKEGKLAFVEKRKPVFTGK